MMMLKKKEKRNTSPIIDIKLSAWWPYFWKKSVTFYKSVLVGLSAQ